MKNKVQLPTPQQIYQQFDSNEIGSRQLFEILYNSHAEVTKN